MTRFRVPRVAHVLWWQTKSYALALLRREQLVYLKWDRTGAGGRRRQGSYFSYHPPPDQSDSGSLVAISQPRPLEVFRQATLCKFVLRGAAAAGHLVYNGPSVEIQTLTVAASWRRQGVATAMVMHIAAQYPGRRIYTSGMNHRSYGLAQRMHQLYPEIVLDPAPWGFHQTEDHTCTQCGKPIDEVLPVHLEYCSAVCRLRAR